VNDDACYTLRRANPADAPSICLMHVASIRAHCGAHYTGTQIEAWAGPKRPEWYTRAMEAGEAIFVAESVGDIVGFAALDGADVKAVYVAPGWTGRGVGSALLTAVEGEASARDAPELNLESSLNAVGFYIARGYSRVRDSIHCMGDVEILCVTMHKRLTSPHT
jgi:putative acetyltransferase